MDLLIVIDELPRSRLERLRLFSKAEEGLEGVLRELLRRGYVVTLSPIIKTPEEAMRISPIYLEWSRML